MSILNLHHNRRIRPACAIMLLCASSLTNRAMAIRMSAEGNSALALNARSEGSDIAEAGSESLLQVDLNQQGLDETVLLIRTKDGGILLAGEDLARWRVTLPAQRALSVHGKNYYRLQAIPGASYRLDEVKQLLSIELPAAAFERLRLDSTAPSFAKPDIASPGAMFNYDALAEHSGPQNRVSGFFELGVFSGNGVGVASFIASHAADSTRATRLETGWTIDQPGKLASLRIGDTISRSASAWGRSVHFAGLQYASNFVVQPGLFTMPQQNITGQAALPSTVDVFVNNALVQRSDVPPGPFSVSNIPVVTGQGDVRVVVRDLLGREQIISQPFYASTRLLRSGLNDFSYEIGKQRENFGVASNDYSHWLAAATLRRGFCDVFTGELHAEAMPGRQTTLGFNGVVGVPAAAAVLNGSVAASNSKRGGGHLIALGFEMQKGNLNVSGRAQIATQDFVQIGLEQDQLAARRLTDLNAGYAAGNYGTFGVGYVLQDNRGTPRVELVAFSYSTNMGKWAYLGITLLKSVAKNSRDSVGAFLVLPLDARTSASANAQRVKGANGSFQINAQVQRALDPSAGFGYRLQASHNGPRQAEVSAQNGVGTYTFAAASQEGSTAVRATMSGGIVALGGRMFASRRITDSFALVQVPGYSNVRVYTDNQLAGRTDADGNALIPRIRAYEKNPVTIESLDLPLDARVDALKLDAVAFYRSGVVVRFPVFRARGGTLNIHLANGAALPVGAQVHIDQQAEIFPVAADGEVYLSGLSDRNVLHVSWDGHGCRIPLTYPASNDPVPFLGNFLCEEVNP